MALTWILNKRLDINIREELEEFNWNKARWSDEKLISCSPFRNDSRPSFFVNLDNIDGKEIAGTWLDSASVNDDFKSGNFINLLSYLRQESLEDTYNYLVEKYDFKAYKTDLKLSLNLSLKDNFKPLTLPTGLLDNTYLTSRGISSEVIQEANIIKVDDNIAIPWYSTYNEIIAIKYRNINSKYFFYSKGGQKLNENLYNLNYVIKNKCKTIFITEAEIDTLSLQTIGYGAVALGSANFSEKQSSLLIRTGADNIVIATDNDPIGHKAAQTIHEKLNKYFTVYRLILPQDCKDVNDFLLKYPNKKLPLAKYKNTEITTKLELKQKIL